MKKIVLTTLAVAAFAFADAPAAYATCKACHGAKGEINITTKSASHVPANLTKAEIEKALHGYKDGTYGGPMKGVMAGQVKNLTEADIKDISAQIAAIK